MHRASRAPLAQAAERAHQHDETCATSRKASRLRHALQAVPADAHRRRGGSAVQIWCWAGHCAAARRSARDFCPCLPSAEQVESTTARPTPAARGLAARENRLEGLATDLNEGAQPSHAAATQPERCQSILPAAVRLNAFVAAGSGLAEHMVQSWARRRWVGRLEAVETYPNEGAHASRRLCDCLGTPQLRCRSRLQKQ